MGSYIENKAANLMYVYVVLVQPLSLAGTIEITLRHSTETFLSVNIDIFDRVSLIHKNHR